MLDFTEVLSLLHQVQDQEGDHLWALEEAVDQIEKAKRDATHKKCGSLSVTVNGRRLVEHEEGCDIFQPGVLNDPRTGDIFKSRAEVR